MGRVFLSYDHRDSDRARAVAHALEKAGHQVWWDLQIRGGEQYAKVIDEELKAADVVVVLWSERSVESAWVRDEAAAGRDDGRLVPVLLDGGQPPLGFRQLQNVDLSAWKGRLRAPEFRQLLDALNSAAGKNADLAELVSPAGPPARATRWRFRGALMAGLAAGLLVVAAAIAWQFIDRPSSTPMVMVAAADQSPRNSELAQDLLVKLGSLRAAKTDAVRLVGAGSRGDAPDFVFETSGSQSGSSAKANLALLAGKDRTILWSRSFRHEGNAQAALEQELAYTGGQVLDCALEASQPGQEEIGQDTLKLFLNGCALFAEKYRTDPQAVVPIFVQIVQKAPGLEAAWRKLLLAESLFTRTERLLSRHTTGELPRHIAAARKLNGNLPELYVAESVLLPINAFARRSELLDRAVRLGPDNPDLLLMRAEFYAAVGRMADSVDDAARAVDLNPLSPGIRSHMIAELTYAGRLDSAKEELRRAEELWPDSPAIDDAAFRLHNRYGDPKLALQMFRAGGMNAQPMVSPLLETFLLARIDPTEANVRRAMAEAQRRLWTDPRAYSDLIQTAGVFHREDELYELLLGWPEARIRDVGEVVFRPTLARFRQDRRFMQIAARAGLIEYWRTSGKWPDFCFESELPYDCKKEAAKLR